MEDIKVTPKKKKEPVEAVQDEKSVKAPREKKPVKKAKDDKEPEPTWYNDGRLAKVSGLTLILLSFILATAFTSYLFTLSDDQSEMLNSGLATLADNTVQAKNALGRLGAWLSHQFINNLFGLSSYLIPLTCFVIGFNLLVRKNVFPAFKITIYSVLGIVWFSSALAFANGLVIPNSVLSWGGAFGNYLTGTTGYLTGLLKPVGVAAALTGTALAFAIVVYNINFGFILNMFNIFDKKDEALVSANNDLNQTIPARTTVPAYIDTDENIFSKDKIDDEVLVTPPVMQDSDELVMEVIDLNASKRKKAPKEDAPLELEVETVMEEAVAQESFGAIGTTYDPTMDLSNYKFPGLELLEEHGSDKVKIDADELERNKNQIISTLNNYQIEISKIKATIGPTVTLYEIVPAPGVRISKIKNLEDDIALSLAALGIRIIAPIPGKGTIGIEVPNINKEIVSMRSLLASEKFQNTTADLPICLGKSISNEIYVADLAKMPHLLMAGATGQGKSVGINSIIVSLLYKKHPSQLKFILVDPKKVELSLYEMLENTFWPNYPARLMLL